MNSERDSSIIKLRGLPFDATAKDILMFLEECNTPDGEKSVHLAISHRDGRPNGEAFVELCSPQDVEKAFEYNKNVMRHRYIEIFNAKLDEFETCLRRSNLVQHDTFVKLRGLPFSCTVEDILEFFQGLQIRNGTLGIYLVNDSRGRSSGEAFVQFCDSEQTDLAMKRNREKIGQRYIEIFRSSSSECRRATLFSSNSRFSGSQGNGGGSGGGGYNDRGMSRGGGGPGGPRNNRSNFRDRPYPQNNFGGNNMGNNDSPWKSNRNNFDSGNNMYNNSGNGGNNLDSMNDFNSSNFERNWNSGGNSNSSFNSYGNGGGNKNFNNDRGNFGRNNNYSNNDNGNFGNDNDNRMNNRVSPYAVHLRGMPYDCYEEEIQGFFAPLNLVGCQVLFNNNGRHTGEADAYFATISDAMQAMKRHKDKMGSRYIELFAKTNDRH